MTDRRDFLIRSTATLAGASAVSAFALGAVPEAATAPDARTRSGKPPGDGRPYLPVITLNGWTLPWRMKDGVKEFHLVAEPVERELAPGMVARL